MRTEDAYSPHKAVRHLDVVQAVRGGRPARPAHVQIILSDACNQACNFCAYRDPSYTSSTLFYEVDAINVKRGLRRDTAHPERNYNPSRMIPWPKVQEILDDCAAMGVSGVQFTGGGEPTVHPRWMDAIRYAHSRGLATSLVTNGVNVDRDGGADVVATMAWLRFSVDAGDAATYTATRNCPDSHWDRVWANVAETAQAARRHRQAYGHGAVVGVGYVVTPDNWRGIHDAVWLAREAGADNIRISARFSADDERLFADCHEAAAVHARAAESLQTEAFRVYNRFGEKLDDLRQKAPDYPRCGYQHFTTYIGADLNLYRCCVYAYHPTGLYGSIKERRFRDAWMDEGRARGMADFDTAKCERCQFNGINRFLNYALRADDPAHSAFV